MHQLARNDGRLQFIAQGLKRFRIDKWLSSEPPYHVHVEYLNEDDDAGVEELRAYSLAVINTLKELIPLKSAVFRGIFEILPQPLQHSRSVAVGRFRRQPDHGQQGRVAKTFWPPRRCWSG